MRPSTLCLPAFALSTCVAIAASAQEAPPATGTLFDLSTGITNADLSDVPVALDGHFGWVARHWGVEAFGARSYTKTRPDGLIDKTVRWSYGAAGRVMLGAPEDRLRFEGRAEFGYADYQDGWMSIANDSRDFENIDLTQATLLAGARFREGRLFGRLSLGAGWLRDSFHHFAYDPNDNPLRDETDTRSGVRWVLRLATRYEAFSDVLALRLTVDASTFDLRRVQFHRRGDAVPVESDWTLTQSRETFARIRAFGDVEPLSFAGIVPGVFVGLDYLSSEASPDRGGVFPIAGIALVQRRVLD